MRIAAYIGAVLLFAVAASAAPTLYPEPSSWGLLDGGATLGDRRAEVDAMAVIAAKMPEGFGPAVRLRVLDDQTGRGTTLIALTQVGNAYRIVAAWSDAWLKTAPHAHVSRCAVPVDAKIADDITAAWKGVLLATSYRDRPAFGAKDSIEHYAMSLGGRWLAGWTYAPEAASAPGQLHSVAQAMFALCQRDDAQTRDGLQTALNGFRQN